MAAVRAAVAILAILAILAQVAVAVAKVVVAVRAVAAAGQALRAIRLAEGAATPLPPAAGRAASVDDSILDALRECVQALEKVNPNHPALDRSRALLAWHGQALHALALLEARRDSETQCVVDVFE